MHVVEDAMKKAARLAERPPEVPKQNGYAVLADERICKIEAIKPSRSRVNVEMELSGMWFASTGDEKGTCGIPADLRNSNDPLAGSLLSPNALL